MSRDSVVPQKRLIASLVSFTAIALMLEITETRAWTTTIAAMMVTWVPRLRLSRIVSQLALTIFILHLSLAGVSRAVRLATYPLYFLHLHIGGLVATRAVVVSLFIALAAEPVLAGWIRKIGTVTQWRGQRT